jgi:hypothetical protein
MLSERMQRRSVPFLGSGGTQRAYPRPRQ